MQDFEGRHQTRYFDHEKIPSKELIEKVKPSKAKGIYMKSITMCLAMSPGVKIEPSRSRWEES